MRNLIFGTLKVVEVILAFVVVGLFGEITYIFAFFDWIRSISSVLFWIVDISLCLFGLTMLIKAGFFPDWLTINWKWTDNIICSFKKRWQK